MYHFNLVLMAQFKHRARIGICADILKTVSESQRGRRKTNIMQSANLNYNQVNKYLDLMLYNGFLILTTRDTYRITNKGLDFLRFFEALNLKLK